MASSNFIIIRLGKDSIPDIKKISASTVGVLNTPFSINIICKQVPDDYKKDDYAFLWLGSDNSKGTQTQWKQGFKAVGRVTGIKKGEKFKDTSETTVEIVYIFHEAISRIDFLKYAPIPYYWCSSMPVIGIDDHANQTIRSMSGNEYTDIKAFFSALHLIDKRFKEDIIKIEPNFFQYFQEYFPNPLYYSSVKNLNELHPVLQKNPYLPYLTALRTKPFILLAGISGTGKSRIVRKLAQATTTQKYENEDDRWKDNRPENFELIQVKPNWHNSMDVVGFFSNISKKYEFTTFVEFIAKAWLHKEVPYFLCLDEMNLAPVEEYFAEYLSAIESRLTDKDGNYITDPIIKPFLGFDSDEENTGAKVSDQMIAKLIGSLDTEEKRKLAEHFRKKGLTLPPNLMVIGTVNMDETTFSFSRKVLDRAMSVEMNEVDYDKFLSGESELFPLLTDKNELLLKRPQQASEVKENIDGKSIIDFLKDVNTLFEGTPFKLGYRAANEAMLYVAASRDFAGDGFSMENALDEFTLMKILSRIEGDDSRLAIDDDDPRIEALGVDSITDNGEDGINLLNCLRAIVRKRIGADTETEKKINTMYRTLRREHFVSYWA